MRCIGDPCLGGVGPFQGASRRPTPSLRITFLANGRNAPTPKAVRYSQCWGAKSTWIHKVTIVQYFHNKLRRYLLKELRLWPDLLDRHFDSPAEKNRKIIFIRHTILTSGDRHLLDIGKSLLQVSDIRVT